MAQELGGETGIGAEQQGFLAVHHTGVQVRHGHRRRADLGLAVDLGLVLLDDFRVVAAQPLAAHRETTEALAFRDAGKLQERQGAAAGAEEDEACLDLAVAAVTGVLDGDPPAVIGAAQVGDLLVVADLRARLLRQVLQELVGQGAEVDVGTALDAGRGDRFVGRTTRHHQWHPLGEGGLVLGVDHGLESVVPGQRFEALLQVGDAFTAAHEAQVRYRVDEGLRRAEGALGDQVRPELLRHLEHGVDAHGFLDVDAAVGRLRGVVQLAQAGVAGARVVPRVGAFDRAGLLEFDDFHLQVGVEFLEQDRQGRAHDAGAYQQHVDCFVIVLRH